MRDQYAGDVSDLLKFAFLRTLGADDKTIGVGWYYNPADDGRPDGRHREYCDEPKWASFDLTLWSALRKLPEQSVAALEKLPIWPMKTRFHRVPVPSTGNRQTWASEMGRALQEASAVARRGFYKGLGMGIIAAMLLVSAMSYFEVIAHEQLVVVALGVALFGGLIAL